MKRLTDQKVAEELERNLKGLQKAGVEVNMSDLRYVKLAKFEDILDTILDFFADITQ